MGPGLRMQDLQRIIQLLSEITSSLLIHWIVNIREI